MWTHDLLKTYEILEQDGKVASYEDNDKYLPLAPIFHITGASSTQITIDTNGTVINILEAPAKIILPVTIDAMNRTSGACANPYIDNFEYYTNNEKKALLLELLKSWMGDNICLNAIYNCINNNSISSSEFKKDFIRWSVLLPSGAIIDTWKDKEIMNLWINYYSNLIHTSTSLPSKSLQYGTCMITGDETVVVSSSLRGVSMAGSMARIICDSSNNAICTHGGRLNSAEQCYTMGVETSFKVFNTFKYICNNDSIYCKNVGDNFVMWSPEGAVINLKQEGLNSLYRRLHPVQEDQKIEYKSYKKELHDLLYTHTTSVTDSQNVVLMTLKTLTSGRTTITTYSKLSYTHYLDNIYKWETDLAQPLFDSVYVPSIADIVHFAFGVKNSNGILECKHDVVFNNNFQKLIKCRFMGEKIPADILRNLINKCKTMFLYKNHQKLLATTIACINYNLNKEISQMVNENSTDVNYIYGRLLAVYDKLERDANVSYTNAQRYFTAFTSNPSKINMVLRKKINCYLAKLDIPMRIYYEKLLQELYSIISNFGTVTNLNEQFLCGYADQMKTFYTKKEENTFVENT